MYSVNEKVVYPGHGVAVVQQIVEKVVGGRVTKFFELHLLHKDMTVLVPVNNAEAAGIRPLSSQESINAVFDILAKPAKKITDQELVGNNWNKRNKEYQFKLRSGDLVEICKIYRDLKGIAQEKELSFGERLLLQQTEALLVEEISAVENLGEEKALERLRALVCTHAFESLSSIPTVRQTVV